MKRAVLVSLALCALVALAQSARSIREVQAASRSTPAAADFLDPTKALELGNVAGFRVSVCGESGSTLTGGTMLAFMYDPSRTANERVQRNPDLDWSVGTPSATCRVFPDQAVSVSAGTKLIYATSSMTATLADAGSYTDGGWYAVGLTGWTK